MTFPTITRTLKGRLLTWVIRCMARVLWLFKGRSWAYPRLFSEDPRTMTWRDIVYFGYKYYFKPPEKAPVYPEKLLVTIRENQQNKSPAVSKITLSVGGDLMPYDLIKPEYTKHLWDETGDFFFGSDIVFANLETPLDITQPPSFVPEVMLNDMHFNTDDATLAVFSGNGAYRGYDALAVANNHSLDMGEEGLLRTLNHLRSKQIIPVGAASGEKVADAHAIIERQGIRVGFMAYTYSLNQFLPSAEKPWLVNYLPLNVQGADISRMREEAQQLRAKGADIIICSLHCGNAYQAFPLPHIRDLFHRVFETCGIDVIAGGHPHNMQPWEWHYWNENGQTKKGFAIYSLADFIAWDIFTWCHLCAMLKITVSKDAAGAVDIENVQVLPNYMQRDKDGQLRLRNFEKLLREQSFDKTFSKQNMLEFRQLEKFYRLITTTAPFGSAAAK